VTTEYESAMYGGSESQPFQPWSEELAQRLAQEHGLGDLGEAHWKVIHTLREHFVQYGALPPKRLACGINHLDAHCVEELFRGDHEVWRIAGLPQPGSEATLEL